jgi:Tfp pilus assembly protein PilF
VVQKYVTTDYQTEASAFVAQFISDKSSQADQMTKVVLTQASRLAESLGDRDQAQHHQDALAQLAEGTHSFQTVRNAMLSLTASTTDSEAWFSSINNWVAKPLDTLHP